ncbi:MAG: DUF805 domain-containing protein [Cellvibrio sp.]|jgi:Predicted membrane protein
MEATQNPYQTPEGQLTVEGQGYGEINFFSPKTRIGRLRYLSHSFVFMLAVYAILAVGMALALAVSGVFWVLVAASYIGMIVISFILAIQRLHDLNKSGWLCLVMFIPLANLILALFLLFAPGTPGPNNFGLQPPPNKTWNWILGIAFPVIMMLGILAAIAIPAYMGYTNQGFDDSYYQYDYDDGSQYEDGSVLEWDSSEYADEE